ncbi:mannitol-1-phosphate 5-dehydrogenase [Mycoplasmopsis agassizii]|uniref:Mannitol-1-phosphate 5-dehydrogenase n=1 Tax=Mycoplasmopsis agassizii TaxID=33922 RepID=A0ABX4H491_9BACT|nr:mannitol-1-phosphate 5-dehydrogenase [Mycoplasmopsis agassizii]PAF54714.1 mannitol-1-phosphate 5-dehydrogenase [Mycoplasmopsis agassizii]SMC15956.1 mannitol-1-phosphate 5-dehydrogenase [Mycoplasmopsis agassizii]
MNKKVKALHFGAGNIGKALIGELYFKNDFDFTFVDNNQDTIAKLNSDKKYSIKYLDTNQVFEITNFDAHWLSEKNQLVKKLREVNFISTSIGSNNLKFLLEIFEEAFKNFELDHEIAIICFENGYRISSKFKRLIETKFINHKLVFIDTVVDRIVPIQNSKDDYLLCESFYEITIDQSQYKSSLTKLNFVDYSDDLDSYINRKIILVNGTHTLVGLLGNSQSLKYIDETLKVKDNLILLDEFQNQAIESLLKSFPKFKKDELKNYANIFLKRINVAELYDTNSRVIRNPITKISPGERYHLALEPALKFNLDYDKLLIPFRLLINLNNEDDLQSKDLNQEIKLNGAEATLLKYTKLPIHVVQQILNIKKV